MKQKFVKFCLIGTLALSSMGLTACSDEELALGAGVLIGAAVVASSDDDHDHHRHDRRDHRDWDRGGRGGWDRGGRGHRFAALGLEIGSPELAVPRDVLAASNHYQVSTDAAARILSALQSAQNKDFTAISSLGLTREDLMLIGKGENPSASALMGLSGNLGIEVGEAHEVIQQMKLDLESVK